MALDRKLPLTAHLEEMRKRIFIVLAFLISFSIISFYFINPILRILKLPAGGQISTLTVFSPTAAILSYLKIALSCGLVLSLPVFLYELWMFVTPALDERYARNSFLFIMLGTVCFILGAAFSFFFLIPAALRFLLSVGSENLQFIISLEAYISFILFLLLGGGFVFEMPLLVYILSKLKILTARKMITGWKAAAIFILIGAAVITPTPDIVNMVLMSLPILFLYIVSIEVARFAERKKISLRKLSVD